MNPRLVVWDYNKEINLTLEDALLSFESLRFMLGGAIHKIHGADDEIVVHHSEEVVCGVGGKLPKPIEHLSKIAMTPVASATHPIRLINITKGYRTQITSGSIDGSTYANFKNSALIDGDATSAPTTTVASAEGDHIRIFWDEVITSTANAYDESAVEVTISPNTFPGTLILHVGPHDGITSNQFSELLEAA